MLIRIGLGLLAGAAIIGIRAARRPDNFRIARSRVIAAPIDILFTYVNDFHLWPQWSPFAKLDPELESRYEGADYGVGAVYGWRGNRRAGEGQMTIRDNKHHERIGIDLKFSKPMKANNLAEFSFEPVADGVRVTWAMTGKYDLLGKLMGLFMDMDSMVGKSFAEGLASLETVAQSEAKRRGANVNPNLRVLQ